MNLPSLILASASPRRCDLLRQMGLEFAVVPARTPEPQPEHFTPMEICQLNAHRKARAVAKKHPDALVIGADTLVCLENRIFGKPQSLADAENMLLELQGREHHVITGVSLIQLRSHREKILSAVTRVTFHPLTIAQVRAYLGRIHPLDKAGAYAIQQHGELIVERIEGSFTNVVGLPLALLRNALQAWSEDPRPK